MTATIDWITLAEAKEALNISGTTHDNEIGLYVTAVSRRLDKLTTAVIRTVTAETANGGLGFIDVKYRPISSITTLTEWTASTSQVLTAETLGSPGSYNYLFDPKMGAIWRRAGGSDSAFPEGRNNVVVTYVAGRFADTAAVAAEFKLAACLYLTHLWRREQGSGSATFGAIDDAGLPTFGIPEVVMDMLADEIDRGVVIA